jgi:hypothetical protein
MSASKRCGWTLPNRARRAATHWFKRAKFSIGYREAYEKAFAVGFMQGVIYARRNPP